MTDPDPYLDPATGILRNRLGITTQEVLDEVEVDLATLRVTELEIRPLPGIFDLAHLCAFHKAIFGDIYDWAGQLRTVEISKSAAPFCLVLHLHSYAAVIFEALQDTELSSDLSTAADELARHLSDINALHPFREGNGRTQRSFIRLWAAQFGWSINWEQLDKSEHDAAYEASFMNNDRALLRSILHDRLEPL